MVRNAIRKTILSHTVCPGSTYRVLDFAYLITFPIEIRNAVAFSGISRFNDAYFRNNGCENGVGIIRPRIGAVKSC